MWRKGMLRNLFAGFLIGIGCILPGVSGGVMAVSFGLYRPMLDAIAGFFKKPRQHACFLLPLAVGGAAGIGLGALLLGSAMVQYEGLMLCLFTGFILGGVPDLLSEAERKERFRLSWLGSLLLGVALALPLSLFGGQGEPLAALSPVQAFLTGVLEGIGTLVPGVSTSFVLIRLGWYQAYLQAFSSLAADTLLLLLPGFALSALLCIRGVQWLFDRHSGHACYGVLGFLLVSVALVFPGFSRGAMFWAEGGMLVIGIVCSRWLGQIKEVRT